MSKKFDEFQKPMTEASFWNWLAGSKGASQQTPTTANTAQAPAEEAAPDLSAFYTDLQNFVDSGKSIALDMSKKLAYSKFIEEIQAGLTFLGFQLPRFGVDGLFGPETARAITQFNTSYPSSQQPNEKVAAFPKSSGVYQAPGTVTIDSDFVSRLISALKKKNFSATDIKKYEKPVVVALSSEEDEDFYKAILTGLGANVTDEKLKFLKAWRQGEGGRAKNNPFNTTKNVNAAGVSNYNSVGVKNYPDKNTGLWATLNTLKLPYYRNLVGMLRDDNVTADELASCPDLHTWGTGNNAKNVLASGNINPPPIYA